MADQDSAVDTAAIRKVLGKRTADLRRAARPIVSQEELARRVGISRSYLAKIERGEKDLPVCLAVRIARELRVPLGEFLSVLDDGGSDDWHDLALRMCRTLQRSGVPRRMALPAIDLLSRLVILCTDHQPQDDA